MGKSDVYKMDKIYIVLHYFYRMQETTYSRFLKNPLFLTNTYAPFSLDMHNIYYLFINKMIFITSCLRNFILIHIVFSL